jgi:hypothetical protein
MHGTDIVSGILARKAVTAEEVALLRKTIFADGACDRDEADLVFQINDECGEKDESWNQLYVDALTDHFVWKARPCGYVNEEQARYLMQRIVRNNRIDTLCELELLCNVIHWAEAAPAELAEFVLRAVKESVLEPDGAAYGQGRRPDTIDARDIELIKRAVYAPATAGSITITRREADVIFDLNDRTIHADNDPGWPMLFVYTIASHLMFPRAAPVPAPAEEVLRREEWLKERRGTGKLLIEIGKETVGLASRIASNRHEFLNSRLHWAKEALKGPVRLRDMEKEARDAQIAYERETIDEEEALWLIERIRRDGVLHENEKELLTFIKNNSPKIHPHLNSLFKDAGFS